MSNRRRRPKPVTPRNFALRQLKLAENLLHTRLMRNRRKGVSDAETTHTYWLITSARRLLGQKK